MKKFIYILSILSVAFLSSCDNKAIPESIIDPPEPTYDVNISVSLSDFFQSYDFVDTKHADVPPLSEYYRTFHSEYDLDIEIRTLFYNKSTGLLVDSLLNYSTNTNIVKNSIELPKGAYTAITTLTFASNEGNKYYSLWSLEGKDKLSTAKLNMKNNETLWSLLSCDSKDFIVQEDQSSNIVLTPSPVGAMCYFVMENFHTTLENYPEKVDNKIRFIKIYTQQFAYSYYLNTELDINDRYIYTNATEHDSWIPLVEEEPSDYNENWQFFEGAGGLCNWFYILAPQCNIQFGYVLEGKNTFNGYGEDNYTIQSGKTYLAYWNYLYVGNPYFGIANNNIWHNYPDPTPQQSGIATTSHSHKAEKIATKSSHLMNNARRIKMSR